MLGSVGLALDDEGSPLHTFAFLQDKCYTGGGRRGSRPASLAGSVRRLPCERCRDWTWHHVPDAVAALARIVAGSRVGFGRKQETFTLLTSFRLAHEAATKVVRTHFRNRAAAGECTAEGVEALVTGLEAEAAAEMQRAETILASIDPRVQKTMRTLFVANTILAIQRDAVLNLAKKGLISGKELEILLEEVLEDAEDVCRPRRKRARVVARRVSVHRRWQNSRRRGAGAATRPSTTTTRRGGSTRRTRSGRTRSRRASGKTGARGPTSGASARRRRATVWYRRPCAP